MPRPGDLTVPFAGGPISLYLGMPKDDVIADVPEVNIDSSDGFLFVLAHVGKWCYVVTSSMKIGWVFEYDVGPGQVAGSILSLH